MHAHEHDHHDGAEDRRKNAAFGVGLARIAAQELPQAARVNAGAAQRASWFGANSAVHIEHRHFFFFAARRLQRHAHPFGFFAGLLQPLVELGVFGLQARELLFDGGLRRGLIDAWRLRGLELEGALIESKLLDAVVDGADLVALEIADRVAIAGRLVDECGQAAPGPRRRRRPAHGRLRPASPAGR